MLKRSIQSATFVLAMCVAFTTGQAQSSSPLQGFDVHAVMDAMSGAVDALEDALEEHGGDTSDPLFRKGIDRISNLINGVNYLTNFETVPVFAPSLQAIDGFMNQSSDESYITVSFIVYVVRGSIATVEVLGLLEPSFIRGDTNSDGVVDIADVVHQLGYLYLGDEKPGCVKAADTNDDGVLDVADPVKTLIDLFVTGSPDPNFGSCARDETRDSLSCQVSSCR